MLPFLRTPAQLLACLINHMIVHGEIDLATFKHFSLTNTAALLHHFEENMEAARKALQEVNDEGLEASFSLKANGQLLYSSPKKSGHRRYP